MSEEELRDGFGGKRKFMVRGVGEEVGKRDLENWRIEKRLRNCVGKESGAVVGKVDEMDLDLRRFGVLVWSRF